MFHVEYSTFRQRKFLASFADGGLCAGFRTPECRDHPRALAAGVGKAPRHEIAVGGALAVLRMGN
jgi:hypothetical protein